MPQNRLAQILAGGPEAQTFESLVTCAERRAERLEQQLEDFISSQIQAIIDIHRQGEVVMFGLCQELGAAALAIAETARTPDLRPTGEIARGLHAMVEGLYASGIWHADALNLHVTSLELFSGSQRPTGKAADKVLARLKQMRSTIGIVE